MRGMQQNESCTRSVTFAARRKRTHILTCDELQCEEDDDPCDEARGRRGNTACRVHSSARKTAGSWVSAEEKVGNVGKPDSNQFLRWLDFVVVLACERLGNGDTFQESNQCHEDRATH